MALHACGGLPVLILANNIIAIFVVVTYENAITHISFVLHYNASTSLANP